MPDARIAAAILLGAKMLCANERAAIPEYQVKAAHVFNFTKFFEWPKSDSATRITICVYGNDPFRSSLEDLVRNQIVHGLPVVVNRLAPKEKKWNECQVLFIALTAPVRIEAVLAEVEGRSIVTVGESESFTEIGGMVGLVVDQGRVRFDINLAAIAAAHLQVSSRLVALGRTVKK